MSWQRNPYALSIWIIDPPKVPIFGYLLLIMEIRVQKATPNLLGKGNVTPNQQQQVREMAKCFFGDPKIIQVGTTQYCKYLTELLYFIQEFPMQKMHVGFLALVTESKQRKVELKLVVNAFAYSCLYSVFLGSSLSGLVSLSDSSFKARLYGL